MAVKIINSKGEVQGLNAQRERELSYLFTCKANPSSESSTYPSISTLAESIGRAASFTVGSDSVLRPVFHDTKDIIQKYFADLQCDPRTPEVLDKLTQAFEGDLLTYPKIVIPENTTVLKERPRFFMNARDDSTLHDRMKFEGYSRAIQSSGGEVVFGKASKGHGWTKDAAAKIGNQYYLPDLSGIESLSIPNNIMQKAIAGASLFEHNFRDELKIHRLQKSFFEGGNIVVDEKTKTILFGFDAQQNTLESAQAFIRQVNQTQNPPYSMIVVPLTFRENGGHAYHLDLALSEPLANGEFLVHPGSIDPAIYQIMKERLGAERFIEISDIDARNLATNLVQIEKSLVMTSASPELRDTLQSKGYTIVTPIVDDNGLGYSIIDGGPLCAAQRLPLKNMKLH